MGIVAGQNLKVAEVQFAARNKMYELGKINATPRPRVRIRGRPEIAIRLEWHSFSGKVE